MFERYTEQARRLVFFARYEAAQLGSPAIDTEHLLLGSLREGGGVLAAILQRSGVRLVAIRKEIEARVAPGQAGATSVDVPLTEHAKKALHYASEEADRLRSEFIGAEHILLGLLAQPETTAGAILRSHGLRLDEVREDIRLSARGDAPRTSVSGAFEKLLELLKQLEERRARYHVSPFRGEALRVEVALAEERWAVTFFADGRVTADVFWLSSGTQDDASLARLLEKLGPGPQEG
jgi:ATP-dependent Clp protease ATP-binding subunit ClpC